MPEPPAERLVQVRVADAHSGERPVYQQIAQPCSPVGLHLKRIKQVWTERPQGFLGPSSLLEVQGLEAGLESAPELVFLCFRLFPRRIADNHVETCSVAQEDFGENYREMEGRHISQHLGSLVMEPCREQRAVRLELLGIDVNPGLR